MIYLISAIVAAAIWWVSLCAAARQDRSPSIEEWDAFREAGERMTE